MQLVIAGVGSSTSTTLALVDLSEEDRTVLWNDLLLNPSFVCMGDGYLFTITEHPDYAMVYSYERVGEGYRKLDQLQLEGSNLCHIVYSGKWKVLFGACYGDGTVFSIQVVNGCFQAVLFHEIMGKTNKGEVTRAHCVVLNQEETQLVVANIALDEVYIYEVKGGGLKWLKTLQTPKGSGPRHAVFSKEDQLLYVITEYSNELLVFHQDANQPLVQQISTLSPVFQGTSNCSTLCLSSDKRHLYAANRGADTITVFKVDHEGRLAYVREYGCGGAHPRHMILSKNGDRLLVCNQQSNKISVFELDAKEGRLKEQLRAIDLVHPCGIVELIS